MPFILGMIVPLVFFDICMEIYHRIGFSLYNLEYVPRKSYIKIDRHKLSYLGFPDKIWCAYCGYANGLLGYAKEIAAQTEKYWCGIKHQPAPDFYDPEHHKDFIEYGNEQEYKKRYNKNA